MRPVFSVCAVGLALSCLSVAGQTPTLHQRIDALAARFAAYGTTISAAERTEFNGLVAQLKAAVPPDELALILARLTAIEATLAIPTPVPTPVPVPVPTPPPVGQASLLVYQGSFTVPAGFEYYGTAMSFNPARNSLFLASWLNVAEISIPPLGQRATLLQPLVRASGGLTVGGVDHRLGGTLVHNGELWFTEYVFYDANNEQVVSHFARPLSASGAVRGPFRVGPLKAGFYSGYMAHVPASLQAALGGPVLVGQCCIPIISRTSMGPAAFAFDPAKADQPHASPLVYYPVDHPTLGPYGAASPFYGGSDTITGLVVHEASQRLLFFGRHGTTYCYGGAECNDPTNKDQGVHGYPYESSVWVYAVSDLEQVRRGLTPPWDVRPIARWVLPELAGSTINGATQDPATGRIFVSQYKGAHDGESPKIHVYTVGG